MKFLSYINEALINFYKENGLAFDGDKGYCSI